MKAVKIEGRESLQGLGLMRATEVAATLGVSKRCFYRMLSVGEFPSADFRRGPRLVRWRADTVAAWVENATTQGVE
jgi:excisionase family DNA binding protein